MQPLNKRPYALACLIPWAGWLTFNTIPHEKILVAVGIQLAIIEVFFVGSQRFPRVLAFVMLAVVPFAVAIAFSDPIVRGIPGLLAANLLLGAGLPIGGARFLFAASRPQPVSESMEAVAP